MPANNPRGLVPTRHLSGGTSFQTTLRSTRGANLRALRRGDPVYIDANGGIQRALVATVAGQLWLGVVARLYNSDKRPLTFSLPAGTQSLAASTSGFVEVYEDPDIVFTIHCSASLAPGLIASFGNIKFINTGTAAGISSVALDDADFTSTAQAHPLKIVRISPFEGPTSPGTPSDGNDVEVLITNHVWRSATRRLNSAPG